MLINLWRSVLKNRLMLISLTLVLCGAAFLPNGVGVASAQARALAPQDDTQVWNDVQVSVPLNKQVDFVLNGTLRVGRDVSHLVDRRIGAGFLFKAGKYLTFYPSFLNIVTRPIENRKGNETRLSFAATARLPLGKFALSDRNLFQRRLRYSQGNSTQYRNRLQIERPLEFGKMQLRIFASDEVFYDWSMDDWVRNRFAIGGSKPFTKQLTGELYYLRQNDGRSRPGDLHVIGTALRVRL